jgi:hypothetical protein
VGARIWLWKPQSRIGTLPPVIQWKGWLRTLFASTCHSLHYFILPAVSFFPQKLVKSWHYTGTSAVTFSLF